MKKVIISMAILFSFGFMFSGCTKSDVGSVMEENVVEMRGEIKAKSGDGYVFYNGEETVNITSNKVDLDIYIKKEITVKGMYSGSTLYVDEVRE